MQKSHKIKIIRTVRRYLIEIPIFFLILALLEKTIFGGVQSWVWQTDTDFPHPFWLGILLFAMVYGIPEGIFTACIASTLYIYLAPLSFGYNPLEWIYTSTLPVFFPLVGLFIGLISNQYKTDYSRAILQVQKLDKQLADLHDIADQLQRSNLNLEKKIVFRLETFQSVYEIAENLNKLHLDQLYKAIPELVSKYFQSEQCSFYLFEADNTLNLKSTHGWSNPHAFKQEYNSNSPLIEELMTCKEITVYSGEDLQKLEVDATFLVALVTEEQELLGIIKIEQMEFMKITQDNLKFLMLLSKWFIQSIINGLRYAQREKESTFDPRTGLVREDTFWFMVKKIVAGAVRHKYDTVLMNLTLHFPEEIGTVEKNMLIHKTGAILKEICRIDDEVGIADYTHEYNFMIMMPHTSKKKAQAVLSKANIAMREHLAEAYPFVNKDDFLAWEILSLEDGTLFLSETVQQMIFDPVLAGKK